MLSKNLVNFRRTLLGGMIILTIVANTCPMWWGLVLGQMVFILLILTVIAYLFEVAFNSVGNKNE